MNEDDADEENDSAGEIVATMPKSLHMKVRVLTARLKKMVDWNDRGELLHEGVAIPGSNITDLVHDLVRRRKRSPQSVGDSSPVNCAVATYPWSLWVTSQGGGTYKQVK